MKLTEYVDRSLILAIGASYDTVWRDMNARLKAERCNLVQALILIAIFLEAREERSPVTPTALARLLGTTRGNISHGITHLERLRHLRRVLDALDARRYHLALTPSGQAAALRLIAIIDGLENRFEDQLGRGTVGELIAGLHAVTRAWREAAETAAEDIPQ